MKMKMEIDDMDITWKDPGLDMNTDVANISVSVWRSLYIKQHLSTSWSSVHEKGKQHWIKKNRCL